MDFQLPTLGSMDSQSATEVLLNVFPEIFQYTYRRKDPRQWRPTPETLAVLEHLAATGPLTVTEAARHFDRSQSAMSEMFDRIIARDLLARMADERDHRRHFVWLTPKGRDFLLEERRVLCPEKLGRALDRMTEDQRANLVAGLQALVAAAAGSPTPEIENDTARIS